MHGVQMGATCGLHAVNHIFASLCRHREFSDSFHPGNYFVDKSCFEQNALQMAHGDSGDNLVEDGGSYYDIFVLAANLAKWDARCFPLAPADLEGSHGGDSVVAGARLEEPFGPHVSREGVHHCLGYILRLPNLGGHWISVLPGRLVECPRDGYAVLCDSLYKFPFLITQAQLSDLLMACALGTDPDLGWRCCLAAAQD